MSTEEKIIYIIDFLHKKNDCKCWSEKFLSQGKQKGYKKPWLGDESKVRADKVPMQKEYEEAQEGNTNKNC